MQNEQGQPFQTVEDAWFWFIGAQEARNDGAQIKAGLSAIPRPCEPGDILKILNNLYRNRLILRDHLLVLRHYGRRRYAPDPTRRKEALSYRLWHEAFDKMTPILIRKNIVENNSFSTRRYHIPAQKKQSICAVRRWA